MKNKIIGIFVCVSMIMNMVLLAGCNGSAGVNNDMSAEATGQTLRIITWENDSTLDALDKINECFFKETGIAVEVEAVDATDYEEFLNKKIAENDVDIFCYTTDSKAFAQPVVDWAPSDMLTWEKIITEGNALDLSHYDFVNNWSTGAEACRYNDGIYGIATGMTIMNGVFYNKKLFEANEWHEPRTWDEFIALCEAIKATGMSPLTAGGADTWPVQMLTNAIVDSVEEGTCNELTEGLWKGYRKFTDEKSLKIYNRESQILSYMEREYLNVKYEDAPSRLTDGKVAMLYDGSWNAFEIEKSNPDFDYDYFAIPGDVKHNFTGKFDLTFGVNAKSDQTDLALKWLEFFSKPDIYTIYIDCNGFVPTMSWISTSNKFLIKIDDRLKDADRTYECFNRVPTDIGNQGSFDLINFSIAGGEYDKPEEFAAAAQEEWDNAVERILNTKE